MGPGQDGVAGTERHDPEDLGRGRGADRRVVLERGSAGEERSIVGRQPADPQAGQCEGLRQDTERDPPVKRLDAGCEPIRRVELEEAIDLVGEEMDPGVGAQVRQRAPLGVGRQHPGRVVRRVDDDQPRRRPETRTQPLDIDRPAVGRVELVQGDVGADRPGDFVQALVARPGHDRVVARPEHHVGQAEDALLGAGEHEDLVRLDPVVERGDLPAQERMSGRLGVAESETGPQGARLVVGQGQQLGHRVALDVRGAQQVVDGELPAGEVPLELELGDPHPAMMADVGRDRRLSSPT